MRTHAQRIADPRPPLHAVRRGQVQDASGRRIRTIDPVRLHLLNQKSAVPPETLRAMADELLPGARRQRLLQIISVALGVLFVGGGYFVYFRWFSSWNGFDPVNTSIMVLQVIVIGSGPVIAFWIARGRYASRVASVFLAHRHCPHCGYNLRGLPTSEPDETTTCPECGCAWQLHDGSAQ